MWTQPMQRYDCLVACSSTLGACDMYAMMLCDSDILAYDNAFASNYT